MSTSIPIYDFFPPAPLPPPPSSPDEPEEDPLELSLAIRKPNSFPPSLPSTSSVSLSSSVGGSSSHVQSRKKKYRGSSKNTWSAGKTETIEPSYPWAKNRRASVRSLAHLLSSGIRIITGTMECKRCVNQFEVSYDLEEKFNKIASFILQKKPTMHHRAPPSWLNPTLLHCRFCQQTNCVKPATSKKRSINWLFLLLGQFLGCCKLADLKYFCKHTNNHRTGAKDRVLYLTYMDLCKQLDPNGPFDI